jgi:hypothetical protein
MTRGSGEWRRSGRSACVRVATEVMSLLKMSLYEMRKFARDSFGCGNRATPTLLTRTFPA